MIQKFWPKLIVLVLFWVPMFYVGTIAAVAVHELLGHAATAVILGGYFKGFVLKWDGMGWAIVGPATGAPAWHQMLILAAGPVATTAVGMVALTIGLTIRRSAALRLTCLLFSITCLLEGPPYLFWNAYYPVPPGDVGILLALLSPDVWSGFWRWTFMGVGAVISIVATVILLSTLFQTVEKLIGDREGVTGSKKMLLLLIFIVVPGCIAWWVFDWNQIAPGIGNLPCVAGSMSVILTGAGLYFIAPSPGALPHLQAISKRHLLTSWSLALLTLVFLWLSA